MLARLADISPEDLKRMGMKDFRRMQKGYLRLVAVGEGEDEGIVELAA